MNEERKPGCLRMLGSSLSGNNLLLSAHHMSSIAGARHALRRMLQLLKEIIVFKATQFTHL